MENRPEDLVQPGCKPCCFRGQQSEFLLHLMPTLAPTCLIRRVVWLLSLTVPTRTLSNILSSWNIGETNMVIQPAPLASAADRCLNRTEFQGSRGNSDKALFFSLNLSSRESNTSSLGWSGRVLRVGAWHLECVVVSCLQSRLHFDSEYPVN